MPAANIVVIALAQARAREREREEEDFTGMDDPRVWSRENLLYTADWHSVKTRGLRCAVCRNLCRNTVLLTGCGHRFCAPCVVYPRDRPQRCPTCSREFAVQEAAHDRAADRYLAGLRAQCFCASRGCTWRGELGALQVHLTRECMHTGRRCERCAQRIPTADDRNRRHAEEKCPERWVHCGGCLAWSSSFSTLGAHLAVCAWRRVTCSACDTAIPQRLSAEHRLYWCSGRSPSADVSPRPREAVPLLALARRHVLLGQRREAFQTYIECYTATPTVQDDAASDRAVGLAALALAGFHLQGYDVVRVDLRMAEAYARAAVSRGVPASRYLLARILEEEGSAGAKEAERIYLREGGGGGGPDRPPSCLLCHAELHLRGRRHPVWRPAAAELLLAAHPPGTEVRSEVQLLVVQLAAAGEWPRLPVTADLRGLVRAGHCGAMWFLHQKAPSAAARTEAETEAAGCPATGQLVNRGVNVQHPRFLQLLRQQGEAAPVTRGCCVVS